MDHDKILDNELFAHFTPYDFLKLAMAALDQAGVEKSTADKIERLATPETIKFEVNAPY